MSADTPPGAHAAAYQRSMTGPDGFWREAASLIDWYTEPTIMDASTLPFSRWFAGGELNTAHNCLDRHVDAGRGDQVALIHDSSSPASPSRLHVGSVRRQPGLAGMIFARREERNSRTSLRLSTARP